MVPCELPTPRTQDWVPYFVPPFQIFGLRHFANIQKTRNVVKRNLLLISATQSALRRASFGASLDCVAPLTQANPVANRSHAARLLEALRLGVRYASLRCPHAAPRCPWRIPPAPQ